MPDITAVVLHSVQLFLGGFKMSAVNKNWTRTIKWAHFCLSYALWKTNTSNSSWIGFAQVLLLISWWLVWPARQVVCVWYHTTISHWWLFIYLFILELYVPWSWCFNFSTVKNKGNTVNLCPSFFTILFGRQCCHSVLAPSLNACDSVLLLNIVYYFFLASSSC